MKQHIIKNNTTLRSIINDLSSETFSILVDDISNIWIRNENHPDVLIKIVEHEMENVDLLSVMNEFQHKGKIESTLYDYIVFTKANDIIFNASLMELVSSNIENNIYSLDNPVWTLYENVADDWEPMINKEVSDMDLPTGEITEEELNIIKG